MPPRSHPGEDVPPDAVLVRLARSPTPAIQIQDHQHHLPAGEAAAVSLPLLPSNALNQAQSPRNDQHDGQYKASRSKTAASCAGFLHKIRRPNQQQQQGPVASAVLIPCLLEGSSVGCRRVTDRPAAEPARLVPGPPAYGTPGVTARRRVVIRWRWRHMGALGRPIGCVPRRNRLSSPNTIRITARSGRSHTA